MGEAVQMTAKQFEQLLATVTKNTPGSTTLPAGGLLHGPLQDGSGNFGPFSGLGVRPDMWSAMVRPQTLAGALGAPVPSMNYNEIYEIQTGVTAASGTNATGWCADPPDVTGDLKVCRQVKTFGRYYGKTKLNAMPDMGLRRNYADVPREILNAGPASHPLIPDLMYQLDDSESRLQYNLWLFGQGVELTIERVLIQGNAALASTATQLGWTAEFDGLDQWIKTGYTDSVTGTTCPAVDSYVLNFGAAFGSTMAGCGDGRYINDAVQDMVYALTTRAEDVRIPDFRLAAVMRKEVFHRLTEYIACNYASSRCTPDGSSTTFNIEGGDYIRWRDAMRLGRYLLVHGMQIPVIFSTGIDLEGIGADTFRTDLYFVPMMGAGRPLTYLQYFPLDNPYVTEYAEFPAGNSPYTPLSGGLWAASAEETAFCKEFHLASQMRLIMDTPYLAGRIDDVEFCYDTDMTRDPYYGESMYADGGVSYRS